MKWWQGVKGIQWQIAQQWNSVWRLLLGWPIQFWNLFLKLTHSLIIHGNRQGIKNRKVWRCKHLNCTHKSKPNYEVTETHNFTFVIHSWSEHFVWNIVNVSEQSKEEAGVSRLFQSFIKRQFSFTTFCACANIVNINISANALWQTPLKSYGFQ